MTDMHTYTSLIVPVTTNGPSLDTLQWSEDGQAFLLTRGAIYVLTPSSGISFDTSSVITASAIQSTDKNAKAPQPLGWYRTMIELEKTPTHHWPFESLEWSTVSLGSLDMSWASITLSPTNLSAGACSVMAALNTNLEVSLWAPGRNYLNGEWNKIQDVTQLIKDSETIVSSSIHKTLNAQVHSISWSQQADLGEGTHYIDCSLLALGNRAGRVIFLQLSSMDASQELRHVATVDVADDWIHHLAWAPWSKVSPDHFQACVACGVPDGGIIMISVSLFLETASNAAIATPRFAFKLQNEGQYCCPCDGSGITTLTWLTSKKHAPILAYTKPGAVHLRAFPSELPLGWAGSRVMVLQLQPLSSGSTPFAAASGLVYYEQHNALLVSLFDGSFHMIHGISTSPSVDSLDNSFSSEELTRQVRTIFAATEGRVRFSDANRISGVLDYDGAGTIAWVHEKCHPDDFSYMHDAKHTSMFIVTRLWMNHAYILDQLVSQLTRDTNFNFAPTHVLRGLLLHLRDSTFLEAHQNRIFELLVQPHSTEETDLPPSITGSIAPRGSVDPLLRINYRRRLATSLFRRCDIHSLRLKLTLVNFCSTVRGVVPLPFGNLTDQFANAILCTQLQAVIRQIGAVADHLEDNDRSFVHRWITQSLAQTSPYLQQEAAALASRVGVPFDSPLETLDFQELCPACRAVIPLGNSSTATCPNGHTWARCSVTSFLLATPFVRTCVGCCRKALLPPSQRASSTNDGLTWLPPAASSWLVQELLEAARWCIFCGNRFVRVL